MTHDSVLFEPITEKLHAIKKDTACSLDHQIVLQNLQKIFPKLQNKTLKHILSFILLKKTISKNSCHALLQVLKTIDNSITHEKNIHRP